MKNESLYNIEVRNLNGEWELSMYDVPTDYKSLVTIQAVYINRGYQPKDIRIVKVY